jgi:hypothetical protein
VDVDQTALLCLGDAELVDLGDGSESGLREALGRSEATSEAIDSAVPQSRGHRVPQDGSVVVEAPLAERRAQRLVVVDVESVTRGGHSVLAGWRAPGMAAPDVADGVDRAERGRGEGREDLGMRRHVAWEPLAAERPGGREEPGVGLVAS